MKTVPRKTPNKAKPQSAPPKPLGRFIVIKNRRVIYEAEILMEAIREACKSKTGNVSVYGVLANVPTNEEATEEEVA
ncbi:hypothetical protein [Schlesneria sp. DSM 10557]|uniref:hypothetical protein n=1 Tax=Schlesneria sp. DSM 10557 TaxID=3044399 RepID=UPI0035A1A496